MTVKPTYEELEKRVQELEKIESGHKYSKEALRESESLFKMLYEKAPLGYQSLDENGHFIVVNQAWLDTLGYTREEVIGKSFADFLHPEWRDHFKENFPRFKSIGEILGIEFEMVKKNGDLILVSFTGKISRDKKGNFQQTHCIFHDITDLKKAENVLREREELLSLSQELGHIGSWKLDLIENCLTWSDEVYRIFGYEPQEISATYEAFLNAVHPNDRSAVDEAYSNSLREENDGYEIEHRVIQKNSGEIRYVQERCIHERNKAGTIIQSIGMVQDITERKRAEEALKASEKKYQSLFENAQVALFRNRLSDGKVLEINERYAKMAGYSNIEDCMAEFNAADAWVDPNGRKVLLKILQENGFVSDYETEIIRKDGTNIWISFSATIFPEQGFLEGSIVDITERKRSEIEQKKLQAQLLQAQKMESVGRLAGGVAHDFNNMLGVILGHTELALLQADENHDLYSDLKEIQKAAKHSADITKKLLAFARKQTISPRQLDLNDTVESMLNMLRRLIREDIDLIWQPASDLWPVKMDPSQIDQILANLCVNARDAISGVGKLTIEIGRKTFDEEYCREHPGFIPGDFVLLTVSDNGSGMDKDTLDNLFEPFFTTKDVGKGTGLGLATIYGIVKQNNGFINVYSEPGQGSTFNIYLPRLVADEDTDKAVPDKKAAAGGTETILLVEDEPSILRMTRMMLERKGYTVLSAATPTEAMEKVKSHSDTIDLLMTDVVMPEMNGLDLAGQITDLYPDIRLLFMSGYTANVIAHQGVLDEDVAFIQKPFSMADLAEKLREVLDLVSKKTQE